MDLGRVIKWVVALAVVFFIWKTGLPWLKSHGFSSETSTSTATTTTDSPCVRAAEQASESWGSGISRFANPSETTAWQTFRGMVEGRIGSAESACSCGTQSCAKVRDALRELRAVVNDMDNALRSNSPPPGDIVQRQESIDNKINEARDLVRSGN